MVRNAIALFAAALIFVPQAEACTGIRLIALDGGVVPGRTLEFGFDLKSDVVAIPKGTAVVGSTPDGSKGMTYTTKYSMLGANAVGLPDIIDGINDQGLYVGIWRMLRLAPWRRMNMPIGFSGISQASTK